MKYLRTLAAGLLIGAAALQFSTTASGQGDGWVKLIDGNYKAADWSEVGKALRMEAMRRQLDEGRVDWLNHTVEALEKAVEVYETMANLMHPCRVIGIFVNGQHAPNDEAVADECERVEKRLGLPTCDVIRHGPAKLVAAVEKTKFSAKLNGAWQRR